MNSKLDLDSTEVVRWNKANLMENGVTNNWLLGFIEAEETFGIKNLRFSININVA